MYDFNYRTLHIKKLVNHNLVNRNRLNFASADLSVFQVAFKRSVIAAKGIESHFSAEAEADEKGIEAAFTHQLSVSVAEIEEQRLVIAV